MTAGGLDQNYLVDADQCKQMIRDKLFRPRPTEPLSLHHFSVKECHQQPADQDLVEVGLVQEKPTYKVRGYRCRVRMTVHRFICGLFSYEKPIMTAGGLDHSYLVDADECKQMIRDKLFRPRPTAKFTLEIPGETFVRDITLGATSCLLYTSPSPRDMRRSRMPSSA